MTKGKGKSSDYIRSWREHAMVVNAENSGKEKTNWQGELDLSMSASFVGPFKYWIAKAQLGDTADLFLDAAKRVPKPGTTIWGVSWKPDEAKWVGIDKEGGINTVDMRMWLDHPIVVGLINRPGVVGTITFYDEDTGKEIDEETALLINDKFDPTAAVATPPRRRLPAKRDKPDEPLTEPAAEKRLGSHQSAEEVAAIAATQPALLAAAAANKSGAGSSGVPCDCPSRVPSPALLAANSSCVVRASCQTASEEDAIGSQQTAGLAPSRRALPDGLVRPAPPRHGRIGWQRISRDG